MSSLLSSSLHLTTKIHYYVSSLDSYHIPKYSTWDSYTRAGWQNSQDVQVGPLPNFPTNFLFYFIFCTPHASSCLTFILSLALCTCAVMSSVAHFSVCTFKLFYVFDRGGKICLTDHFKPLWARNVPKFGIAHAMALGVSIFLWSFFFYVLLRESFTLFSHVVFQ